MNTMRCREVTTLLIGDSPFADAIGNTLMRFGHPVLAVRGWREGVELASTVEVAIIAEVYDADLFDLLRAKAPQIRIIYAPPSINGDMEEQVALREFVRLRTASPNMEEFHALLHDMLVPTPSPQPTALA